MKAIISLIFGMISFVLIAGMQMNLLLEIKLNNAANHVLPTVYSIAWSSKIFVLILGLVAMVSSIFYTRSKKTKLGILNKFGLLLGILAILLCLSLIHI